MEYLSREKNKSGAYPPPTSKIMPNCYQIVSLQSEFVVKNHGFVIVSETPDPSIHGSSVTITTNVKALEDWENKEAVKPEPEPEPAPEYVTYSELAAAIREGVNAV